MLFQTAASRPVAQHASPWNFEQLCRTAAAAAEAAATATATRVASGRGPPTPDKCSAAAPRMLAHISSDDVALFAKYLVRTKRAVTEGGLLKVLSRGGGSRVAAAGATVSETEKDLLRLRCTGERPIFQRHFFLHINDANSHGFGCELVRLFSPRLPLGRYPTRFFLRAPTTSPEVQTRARWTAVRNTCSTHALSCVSARSKASKRSLSS